MTKRAIELAHGLHKNVPPHVYHSNDLGMVSKSALDLMDRSPAHYKASIDGTIVREQTAAFTLGAGFHCALLEPDRFAAEYAVEPDFGDCRKKDNKAARDAWRDAHSAHLLLSEDDALAIAGMTKAIREHPLAGKMVVDGDAELTVRWRDEETGLECRSRADYYVRRLGMVADVKTTLDARPGAFRRDVANYRYHVQDALYRAGFAAVGAQVQHFVFIAVEKAPPFAVAMFSLDAEGIGKGYAAARRGIDAMAACMKTGEWPAYSPNIQQLNVPPWAA